MKKVILSILLSFLFIGLTGCVEEVKYKEGDTKCIGVDFYTFVGNQWTLTERNCQECGYVPEHYNGEIKCDGYDKWVYSNGLWILVEENSEDCGYISTDNSKLISFIYKTDDEITNYTSKMRKYMDMSSYSLASYYSDELYDLTIDSMDTVYTFSVSSSYEEIQDEYYYFLYYMALGALYTGLGCDAMASDEYILAIEYYDTAIPHIEASNTHLENVLRLILQL